MLRLSRQRFTRRNQLAAGTQRQGGWLVCCVQERSLLQRREPSSFHPQASFRVLHESLPDELAACVLRHQEAYAHINAEHVAAGPAHQGIEGIHEAITLPYPLAVAAAQQAQHAHRIASRTRLCPKRRLNSWETCGSVDRRIAGALRRPARSWRNNRYKRPAARESRTRRGRTGE